jgi:glucose/arabinose dehydrogenase/lysophospholipase L1-like esterase
MKMSLFKGKLFVLACLFAWNPLTSRAQVVPVEEGDTICIVGGALAEGIQWVPLWEVLLQARFTEANLRVRYLGRSGDTVFSQPREKGEPSLDETLSRIGADLIFAYFGQAEAAAGQAGLPEFEAALEKWVMHTRSQNYNGTKPPMIVLVSPPPFEATGDPALAEAMAARNVNLQLYVPVMQKIARENDLAFVDAFSLLTSPFLGSGSKKFTTDGVHLSRAGHKLLGGYVDHLSFGRHPNNDMTVDEARLMMAAIADRNTTFWQWYHPAGIRFAYGDDSSKTFSGKTNGEILGLELEALEALTESLDKQIWAFAQRRRISDVDATIKSAGEVLDSFRLDEGFEINLYASEAQFPELKNPTSLDFDVNGKMLVTVAPSYPQALPGEKPNDKVLLLEDSDDDGTANCSTVFADGLYLPNGIAAAASGGAYVSQASYLSLAKYSDGDGKVEIQHVLGGLGTNVSGLVRAPGGGLYLGQGPHSISGIESTQGIARLTDGGILHYDPKSGRVDTSASYPFGSPPSVAIDAWGQRFASDNAGSGALYITPASGALPTPDKHPKLTPLRELANSASAGAAFVSSSQWPDEFQGRWLVSVGSHISMLSIADADSGYKTDSTENLLKSTDSSFLPVDLKFGPDGALYIVDFCDPLRSTKGLDGHGFRDPNRDRTHGRIWRVTAKARPAVEVPNTAGASAMVLLDLLKSPDGATRSLARIVLCGRPEEAAGRAAAEARASAAAREEGEATPATTPVATAAKKAAAEVAEAAAMARLAAQEELSKAIASWIAGLDKNAANYDRLTLEALWVQEQLGIIDESHLKLVLASKSAPARAAAVRVLRWNQSAVEGDGAYDLMIKAAADDHPRVRLEAIVAATYLQKAPGANVALTAGRHPTDAMIDYAIAETLRFLKAQEPVNEENQPDAK